MNLQILYNSVGKPFNQELQCLLPVYILFPDIKKYEINENEEYFLPIIKKYGHKICENELTAGDLVVFKLKNHFHFGIYAENDYFFHSTEKEKLRLSRLFIYKKWLKYCYRYKNG